MDNRSKSLSADERRSLTVESVVELAASQNPSEITTAAIAHCMRVTEGALFRHFASKDAIWEAVMQWVAKSLLGRLDHAAANTESSLDAMQAMFMSHVEFVAAYPGVPRMMFGELQRARMTPAKRMARALVQRYKKRLLALIEKAKATAELPATLDSEAAAILFVGTIQGLVMQSLLADEVKQMRRDAPRIFAIYRRGIKSTQ